MRRGGRGHRGVDGRRRRRRRRRWRDDRDGRGGRRAHGEHHVQLLPGRERDLDVLVDRVAPGRREVHRVMPCRQLDDRRSRVRLRLSVHREPARGRIRRHVNLAGEQLNRRDTRFDLVPLERHLRRNAGEEAVVGGDRLAESAEIVETETDVARRLGRLLYVVGGLEVLERAVEVGRVVLGDAVAVVLLRRGELLLVERFVGRPRCAEEDPAAAGAPFFGACACACAKPTGARSKRACNETRDQLRPKSITRLQSPPPHQSLSQLATRVRSRTPLERQRRRVRATCEGTGPKAPRTRTLSHASLSWASAVSRAPPHPASRRAAGPGIGRRAGHARGTHQAHVARRAGHTSGTRRASRRARIGHRTHRASA